jgi:outer membrane protein assembly factor BamE (lipoprotein component of BamABCDE complex)
MKKLFILIFLGFFIYGCASAGNPAITDSGNLNRIQEGVSKKGDVRSAIGAPVKITPMPDGELWEYGFGKSQVNPAVFIPLIGLGIMASGYGTFSEIHHVSILFDNQGIVRKIEAGKMNPKTYKAPFYGKISPGEYESMRSTPATGPAPIQPPPPPAKPNSPVSGGYAPVD